MDAFQLFLSSPFLGQSVWLWFVFVGIVAAFLTFDLGVLHNSGNDSPL
jgi:tellurite resistance protein TerC